MVAQKKRIINQKEYAQINQPRMLRFFKMVHMLQHGRYSIESIMSKLDMSERTVYRYMALMEALDFKVDRDFNARFFVFDNDCPFCGKEFKEQHMKIKSSSGHTHPYMKGYRFWKDMQFWNDPKSNVSEKGKQYFNQSLEEMRMNEKQLTRLTGGR